MSAQTVNLFSLLCKPSLRTLKSSSSCLLHFTVSFSLPGYLSQRRFGTFQVKTHSSSTVLLTRPNFLRVPLSFTPPWIFNYTDEELGKHLSPCFSLSLSLHV